MMVGGEVMLGVIGAISTVYDKVDKAYSGCKVMAHFGVDMRHLWWRLEWHWTNVHVLLQYNTVQLDNRPEPGDENHPVIKTIRTQLFELERLFIRCQEVIQDQLKHSKVRLSYVAPVSESSTNLTGRSTQSSGRSELEGFKSSETSKKNRLSFRRQQPLRRIWQKAVRRGDEYSGPASPSGDGSLVDTVAPRVEDSDLDPKEKILLGPLCSSLPWAGTEGIDSPVSKDSLIRLQKEAGLWARITWAHHRKDELERCVSDIGSTVSALEKFLALRVLEKPQALLPSTSAPPEAAQRAEGEQEWLRHLHLSLCNLQKRSSTPAHNLSISLLEDAEQLWIQVKDDQPDLPLKDEGVMLWAQLDNKDKPTLSTFLMIESAETKSAPTFVLENLSQPDLPETESNVFGDFRMWGSPPPSLKTSNLAHSIFAEHVQWQRKLTLRDIIQHLDSAKLLTRSVVTELTYQLLLGFKRLILINSTCSNLRSDNIVYCRPAADGIDFNEPDWLLHPYVKCGFGSPTPERRLGVQSGPLKDPNASIIEMGLVLFQIGSRRIVEYDVRSARIMPVSLVQARRQALNNLDLIERWNRVQFANVVSACLQAKADTARDVVDAAFATLVDVRNAIDTVDEVFLDSEIVASSSEIVGPEFPKPRGTSAQQAHEEKRAAEQPEAGKNKVEEAELQKGGSKEAEAEQSKAVQAATVEVDI